MGYGDSNVGHGWEDATDRRDRESQEKEYARKAESEHLVYLWEHNTFPLNLDETLEQIAKDFDCLKSQHNTSLKMKEKDANDWYKKYKDQLDMRDADRKKHTAYVKKVVREKATLSRRINKLLEKYEDEEDDF